MPNIDTRGDTITTILTTILKTIMKTILTRILKTILTTTLTKSLQDMSQIRSRYVTDMLKICLIYAQDMPKICPRNAQGMAQTGSPGKDTVLGCSQRLTLRLRRPAWLMIQNYYVTNRPIQSTSFGPKTLRHVRVAPTDFWFKNATSLPLIYP